MIRKPWRNLAGNDLKNSTDIAHMPYEKRIIDIVAKYQLIPHPEGGYYKETYRSVLQVTDADGNQRPASTAIYFLLSFSDFSAFHRLTSVEMWHHYDGDAVVIHTISPDGMYEPLYLGHDEQGGHRFQAMVRAGYWFASEVTEGGTYALVGCTVSPGFDFRYFELASREHLVEQFPQHAELITRLTRQ